MRELVLEAKQERVLTRAIELALCEHAPVREGESERDTSASVMRAARAAFKVGA